MTSHKHLKDRIRARMKKTGEAYTVARRHVLAKRPDAQDTESGTTGPERFHFPGNVPATTALRVLLSASDLRSSSGPESLSEAMLFGIAGGIGAGVFSFHYEQDDFSSFFIAGRHLWQDDLAYLRSACSRLGAQVAIQETGGGKTADKQMRAALENDLPVVAWVDMAALPRHAASIGADCGGLYHVVALYRIDDDKSEALVGDLADTPDRVDLKVFAQARARIKKQKHRLLWIESATATFDLSKAVSDGMQACHNTLIGKGAVKPPGGKAMAKNFTLDAFAQWADRLHGSTDKQSWERIFPRGKHFWTGLTSVYAFIHYGTGGGLTRPLYSEFFREAAPILGRPELEELSDLYGRLGEDWDALGEAALPDTVAPFKRYRKLRAELAERTLSGDNQPDQRVQDIQSELRGLERAATENFPLTESDCESLRADLQTRVRALHRDEVAAHERLGDLVAATA